MFRTLIAKYPGVCQRCNRSIFVGDRIRYGGPGRLYHLPACPVVRRDAGHAPDFDRLQEDRDAEITREYR
jgi:hypothetical protein